MAALEIRTFGGLGLSAGGAPVVGLDARSAEALLVYLAHADGPVPRDVLAHLFWPDRPRATALANLRTAVHRLRRAIPGHVVAGRASVGIQCAWSDARELESAARSGRFADAAALYRGTFLDGFALDGSPGFEGWQAAEAERYRTVIVASLQELVASNLGAGALAEALDHAQRLLRIDPLHEPTQRAVARALTGSGRRAAALEHLDAFARTLQDELGLEPDPVTLRLAERIRAGEVPGGGAPAANVWASPDDTVPAPGSPSLPPTSAGLPTFPGPIVGRREELRIARARLVDPDCRWLTVLGPGGVGKTRLAVDVAASVAPHFEHGVRFVGLAGVGSPEQLARTLAAALGLEPLPPGDPAAFVAAYLRDKRMLLVLDNLEHLAEAAPGLVGLVRHAVGICVLATSRTRLHLGEEWLLPLDGLADEADAVRLFERHARRVSPRWDADTDRATVREICALVEGFPLALELAATWVHAVPLERIAASLRGDASLLRAPRPDAPDRHHSVAAAFDASWDRLPPDLQAVLARLGVFRGGFAPTEAERVAGASLADLLALVDRSLVRARGDGRFDLHELIRQYALRRLADADAVEETARRHLHAFLDVARRTGPMLFDRGVDAGLARFHDESDNLRAALAWSLERDSVADDALALVEAMGPFWRLSCAIDEARATIARAERLLVAAPRWTNAIGYARGHFAWMAGDFDEAEAAFDACLSGWDVTTPGGLLGRGQTRLGLAMTAWATGRPEAAVEHADAALALLDADRHPWWHALTLGWRGKARASMGDVGGARRDIDACLTAFARVDNAWGMGLFVGIAAELHLARGDAVGAYHLAERAAELLERVGFKHALASIYELLAVLSARAGARKDAERRRAQAVATYRDLGLVVFAEALAGRALEDAPPAGTS